MNFMGGDGKKFYSFAIDTRKPVACQLLRLLGLFFWWTTAYFSRFQELASCFEKVKLFQKNKEKEENLLGQLKF
jgi:hypothetical protein